ncbi:MAG: hypothetical protein QOD06_2397 [Candidatus Binatota bacterium]|jgi:GT2 family glycosyltransferase|nr:hypothetical protein [Candidatus Binatota bacterium]
MSGTAVVIVNWNGLADTRECLRSLGAVAGEWSHVIVVDNASEDGSPAVLRGEFPWVDLIEAGANLGYAGGNNLGIRRARDAGADFVFVLNNDAAVVPGTIAELRSTIENDPRIGVAGPLVYRAGGKQDFWYAGGDLQERPFRVRERTDRSVLERDEPLDVGYVPGCALMMSRRMLDRIGLLDERFFLTWEDTDWSARVRAAGFRPVIAPRSRVHHVRSPSFQGFFSPLYAYYFIRNMLLFARLHFAPTKRPRAYADALHYAWHVIRATPDASRRRAVQAAAATALLHFLVGRWGPAPASMTDDARDQRLRDRS